MSKNMTKIPAAVMAAVMFLGLVNLAEVSAQNDPIKKQIKAFADKHAKMMDETLTAYNAEDYKRFYRHFAAGRRARTEKTFQYMWINDYKGQFGRIVSKTFLPGQSHINGPYPLLVYDARFEKDETVEIKFSLIAEQGEYKIFSLRFDDIKPNDK